MLGSPDKLSYRINEATRATGLGRTTLFALIKEGRLRSTKVGNVTLISADQLRALVAPEQAAA